MNAHIIYTPFTGVGLHGGFRSNKWLSHRIEIFKNYTLKSLQNQKNTNFIHWISFRPEEKTNPQVIALCKYLQEQNYRFVMTFNGLMYHDDKFSNYNFRTKLRNALQMFLDGFRTKEWKSLKEIWRHTWEDKNMTLLSRLTASLYDLEGEIGHDYDWVYLTRIDSDDMFHEEATNLIQSELPDVKKALVMDKGYMFNVLTKQLGEWLPPTNPPFHTIIFPGAVFFNALSHKEYYGTFTSHEDIPKVFNATTLDMYKYCVTAHGTDHISTAWDVPIPKRIYQKYKYARPYCYTTSGKNISTHWQSNLRRRKNFMIGQEYTDPEEKRAIMLQFGIEV